MYAQGALGDVMQESIQAAMTVVRARSQRSGYTRSNITTATTSTSTYQRGRHPKMVQARGWACAQRWLAACNRNTGSRQRGYDWGNNAAR